jgi:hypothetical protein
MCVAQWQMTRLMQEAMALTKCMLRSSRSIVAQVECRSEDGIEFTVKYDKLVIATGSQVSCSAAFHSCSQM